MRKTMQKVMSFYLFLFLLPILLIKLPMLAFGVDAPKQVETQPVAYAANVTKEMTKEIPVVEETSPLNVLLLFTHSHEAYHPIVKGVIGVNTNYDPSTNVTDISDLVTHHLQLNNAQVDVLPYDNMKEMKVTNRPFYQAYAAIRPTLQQQLNVKSYDLVLDIHRDSANHKVTTLESNNESFARIALVVGAEHANYKLNEAYAKALSVEVNRLVPNMSRGVMTKTKDDGNGIYNQDLSPKSILIELGGIENTEAEINRTLAVIAKAISIVFENNTAT
jgi:stage II sporulation protein P